ncbi:hypothetical protein [Endozoicomonas euniceicola]|uniref:RES domain-containing protein n=1 Tax=Endozoicomonas euniceicola TaxID=1234143 RepID=A0ABY6GR33_9GAMM|nr:hypothetical protein [Endozoicomonas euniceicola]UYM14859.1 hypothetical protein NX720_18485 [Endozoicomonas euniceicola]
MMRRWRQRRYLVSESNTLLLTKPIFFQNTTLLEGTAPESRDGRGRRFYGYAFLPDDQDILDAFSKGFYPKYLEWFPRELTDASTPRRFGGSSTIQSYICHYAAYQNSTHRNIYLVDLRELGGIVKGAPNPPFPTHRNVRPAYYDGYRHGDLAFERFPFTREYHRLETLAPVPGEAVIGMVTCFTSRLYILPVAKLKLHINPDYRQGLEGVRAIVDLFNGESDWVMV